MDRLRDPALVRQERELIWVLLLTALFEVITLVFRVGLDLQSTRDTPFLKPYTLGLRIHHGYIGALLVLWGWFMARDWLSRWCRRVGLALILSDLIHHFVVLWPWTGSPHFDLFYP
ncbi:MAG TPA: hypothetical protein PKD86_07610 [Gemmatales bacterium]|nr:hypothetical protein [Gemmatales bacterium]HMP59203.1 hypothetical protein [Gemmatales bacterium]